MEKVTLIVVVVAFLSGVVALLRVLLRPFKSSDAGKHAEK